MSHKVFFTADTHFGHANVIKHANRPFASVDEMDEVLIKNWNNAVGPKDTVYHLGDFAWRDAAKYYDRLNGLIHLIRGNHDGAAEKIKKEFIWFKDVHEIKVGEQRIWLSHYSHEVWKKSHHGVWHLYGHSHGTLRDHYDRLSFDVGVDAVALRMAFGLPGNLGPLRQYYPQDYRPLSFEEVAAIMARKTWKPIDHHTGPEVGP